MKRCIGCNGNFDELIEVDAGVEVCPRCVFVLALYAENGIEKHFCDGDLMPERLNSKYQKILQEFNLNPAKAYETYLPNAISKARDGENGIVRVTKSEFRKYESGKKRFVALGGVYDDFAKIGNEITIVSGERMKKIPIRFVSKVDKFFVQGKHGSDDKTTVVLLEEFNNG